MFGSAGLELKNEMAVNPQQHGYPTNLVQPAILSAGMLQSTAAAVGGAPTSVSLGLSSCTMTGGGNSGNPTPTIYTIEDHGGGHPLVSLTAATGGTGPSCTASSSARQKKRKLSLTDSFSNKSLNVKQEPRKYFDAQAAVDLSLSQYLKRRHP